MVPLFFVLSGFVIHTAYAPRINSPGALVRFQVLRFWRLYPVHLLLLALYLILECIRYIAVNNLAVQDVRLPPFSQNNVTALMQQIFLIQAIGPTGNAQTFNGPAWSISVEFYTYLVFGFMVLICRRWLMFSLVVLMISGLALLAQDTGFENLLTCIIGFSIGALISALTKNWSPRIPSWIASSTLCAFFGYLAIFPDPHLWLVFVLAAGLVFSVSAANGGLATRLLSNPRSLWLGGVSYSLYMSHALVLWLTAIVLKRAVGLPEKLHPDGKWVLEMTAIQAGAASGLSVIAALLIAWLVMRFVEIPVREWSRRRAGVSPLLLSASRESDKPLS